MPPASRRKAKQAKKYKTVTILNHHSSHSDQLQGTAVSPNHIKKMEGSLNGALQDSHKVETQILREDKEVVVEVDDSQNGDIAITDEEAPPNEENKELVDSGKVEVTQDVSESVCETFEPDAMKDGQVENTMESDVVELELKEEEGKDFLSDLAVVNDEVKETDLPSSESNNELLSVSGNEGQRETEVVVETFFKHMMFGGEEKNVLSSVVTDKLLRESEEANEVYGDSSLPLTDVASEETVETSVLKSDENDQVAPTIIEKSLDFEPTLDEIEEPSGGQEESSYESAKQSFQPSPSVPDAESTENPNIVPVAQRENTSWKSCCGLFEIMRGGDR
ncbi:hypothetical protein AAZX31_14G026800 [Glycine max]|uniref:Uncharacterized protein n=4 Tax=Glycine subgen. Soja TaxID=1462606 RepID=I1M6W9_SOYBN|nr:uncharacterized protein LOC100803344 isoform X1 [Glycine max]XP_028199720.1 uncharacterized protein LOC114384261 isoform X1 [Glycine soja]KAG4382197.1 hypothetical protein GLYMA_14G027800v4 [Glycine max]KAG4961952.1 hypothetical protein JHK86_038820 [Glycine max]KAG4964421.1 hypothetical protein JHK85_039396 [Glycine max]KAG5109420.1 hypothetical protein JHK82_038643 [Glycine max]KAG5120705.1 hypothetical protein JHK84_039045 [Glycine max]|eukprot:XP_006595750.1 uncharacterized protein LOC100803344 isoform X1 [Glycine max]